MKKLLILFSIFIIQYSILNSQDTWIQTYQPFYNPAGDNDYYVEDVLVCDDGGYAVNGYYWYFEDWIEEQWGYLMKTDSDGNFLWARKDTISCIDETESTAFVQTDDGGYLSAVYSLWGGTALIKRDSEGNREWVSNCGDLYIHSMDKTNDGNIILGGRMNGLPAIRKINQNAEIDWEYTYYLSGSGNGRVQSITKTSDGGYAATGYTSGNGFDIFVLKVNSIGDSLWSYTFDGYGLYDLGNCIIETLDEEIIIGGAFSDINNNAYGVLIKHNNIGELIFLIEYDMNNCYVFRTIVDDNFNNNIIGYGKNLNGATLNAYSSNGDSLWLSSQIGYPGLGDRCFQQLDNKQFICTGESWEGIILTKTDSTGQVTATDENIMASLSSNLFCYPNPFNPEITISFTVSKPTDIEIKVFNVRGQIIEKLLDEQKEVGKHSIIFNAKEYSSGIYFIQLIISDKLKKVKKVSLIK